MDNGERELILKKNGFTLWAYPHWDLVLVKNNKVISNGYLNTRQQKLTMNIGSAATKAPSTNDKEILYFANFDDIIQYFSSVKEENLDEISQATKDSYRLKATKSKKWHDDAVPQMNRMAKKNKGYAIGKRAEWAAKKHQQASNKRAKGLAMVNKEEMLDELNPDTLERYIDKAQYSRDANKRFPKVVKKREKGIKTATKKLDEATNTVFTVKNLAKRNDIDSVLQHFEHDIDGNKIVMSPQNASKFTRELKKKNINL